MSTDSDDDHHMVHLGLAGLVAYALDDHAIDDLSGCSAVDVDCRDGTRAITLIDPAFGGQGA